MALPALCLDARRGQPWQQCCEKRGPQELALLRPADHHQLRRVDHG